MLNIDLAKNWDEIYWAAWFLLGFGIPEAVALYRAWRYKIYGETLSENVREWFATDVKGRGQLTAWAKARRIIFVCALAWLVFHWLTPGTFF